MVLPEKVLWMSGACDNTEDGAAESSPAIAPAPPRLRGCLRALALGPFRYARRDWRITSCLLLAILLLTLVTQVGGMVLWASLPLLAGIRFPREAKRWAAQLLVFFAIYLFAVVVAVPLLAQVGGRVPLPWFATEACPLRPANIGFCLLARNYVTPPVRAVLERVSVNVSLVHSGSTVMYLDACFPFLDGFPLLPHLSHKDGKKVDLAYFYRDSKTGEQFSHTPSPVGYWAYEQPREGEPRPCAGKEGWLRWDFDWLQQMFAYAEMDPPRTGSLLKELVAAPEVQKILIEPHLKKRLGADDPKVRFQGCHAARHDDHVHLQVP